jgi:hypothetical protein
LQASFNQRDGDDAWAPAKARPDKTLTRALARAHRWKWMLEQGRCRSTAEIAEAEKIDCSIVSRLLRLTLLAAGYPEGDSRWAAGEGHAAGGADKGDAGEVGRAASPWKEQQQDLS